MQVVDGRLSRARGAILLCPLVDLLLDHAGDPSSAVPGARLVELPGEDHGSLQRPDALASVMVEFLT